VSINHPTGTPIYRPAEVVTKVDYKVAPVDIYGLAMNALVIMTQSYPFSKENREMFNTVYKKSGNRERFFRKLFGPFRDVD
jgi:hypothetical protein